MKFPGFNSDLTPDPFPKGKGRFYWRFPLSLQGKGAGFDVRLRRETSA